MFQQLTIVGHAGADAEMRYTPDGTAVTTFSVATSKKVRQANGRESEVTTWFRVTCWRKLAEICGEHVRKGDRLLVTGEVYTSAWLDGRSGEPRAALEVRADTVRFLGKREPHQPVATGSTPLPDAQPPGLELATTAEIPF